MKVAIYARVSSDDQAERGSIQNQLLDMRRSQRPGTTRSITNTSMTVCPVPSRSRSGRRAPA